MRLTLRTLLAYMDDILDPADKEALAKKIESSGFAEDLIYRTQDTMRRLRLSAPQVLGTGMGLDPNTVSEYLDNVLPPDSVGDLERICLESDVHLAEVASSHHVLTMVLGEPADVDPAMRERMYSIPLGAQRRRHLWIDPAHGPMGAAAESATAAAAGGSPAAATPVPSAAAEIPEYLRTSMWSRYHVVLAAAAVILLVAVVAALVVRSRDRLRGGQASVVKTTTGEFVASAAAPTESSTAGEEALGPMLIDAEQAEVPAGDTDEASVSGSLAVSAPADTALPAPPAGERYEIAGESTTPPAGTSTEPPAIPSGVAATDTDMIAEPGGGTIASNAGVQPGGALPAETSGAPIPATGSGLLPRGSLDVGEGEPVVPQMGGEAADLHKQGAEQPSEPVANLGTFRGGNVVLLRCDARTDTWFRLAARSPVTAGDRLLALPAFRPTITLTSGMHVDLSGGTQIVMTTPGAAQVKGLPGADADVPALEVVYGRIILVNTASDDRQIVLKVGPTLADAQLAPGATLAVEVERSYVPGRDPRTSPTTLVARLYARDGEVVWRVGGNERPIREPSRWTIADGVVSAIEADATPPEWIDHEPAAQRSEQMYGAPAIEEGLGYDRPADDQLLELFQAARRREVKSLAARSSIHIGLFTPFVEALRDSDQRANWRAHIEALRAAMALSPESANKVRQALVEQRGEPAAADLYEMLRGYGPDQIGRTPEEIQVGAVATLIDWLENDNLDYRVLAAQNLREITGKNLLSNPAGSLSERALGVRRWRARLESGELVPPENGQRQTQ
jgi:hypothetical protein